MKTIILVPILACLLTDPTQVLLAQWIQTGGPPGGKIWCFTNATNGIVFAGSDAGLYRSTDSGNSWSRASLPFQRCWTVAANPTGHIFTVGDRVFYRSTSNGDSWEKISLESGDPWSVISDGNSRVYVTSSAGLYESVDDGATWDRIDSLSGSYGMCFLGIAGNGSLFGAGYDSGVFRSQDSGRTWKQVQSGSHIYALHATHDSVVYIGAIDGILRTTDMGTSWNRINDGLEDTVVQCIRSGPASSLFAATSGGIYKYDFVAHRWTRCTNGIPSVYMLTVYVCSNGTVLAGSYGRGAYQSVDNGTTWSPCSHGLSTSFVSSLVCTSAGTLVCSDDYAIYRSVDRGGSWTPTLVLPDHSSIVVNAHDSIYVGSSSGFYLSSDDGTTWNTLGGPNIGISPLGVTPRGTLVANTSLGPRRSTDGGTTWGGVDTILGHSISSLVADKLGSLWTANFNGIYRSDNDGIDWSFTGFSGMYGVYSLGVTSNNSLLAGTHGAGMEGYGPTLYRSTDHGSNWSLILEQSATNFCLAQNGWLLSNLSGVQYSTDDGATWMPYSVGLECGVSVMTSAPDGYVYAGTSGGGVYRTTSTLTAVRSAKLNTPAKYYLGQNYPNPFNPSTSIPFELPSKSFVSVKILDVLGREFATLVAEEMAPGTHISQWNGTNVPSGVYFCRLKAGSFTQTRKLLLVK